VEIVNRKYNFDRYPLISMNRDVITRDFPQTFSPGKGVKAFSNNLMGMFESADPSTLETL
jgi:hypothetical protein